MFTVEYRTQVREAIIEKARADPRIESAAAVGGSAEGDGDRWSDLDLSFGVAGAARDNVLADWTQDLRSHFDAVTLFDLLLLSSVYRVFLLPGSLQVDLSFTPTTDFGALGPRFKLLFGSAVERKTPPPGSPPRRVRPRRPPRCPRPLLHRPWASVAGGALDQPRA